MASVVNGHKRSVEGQFPCPFCGEMVITGSLTCPHCGGNFNQKEAQNSVITNIPQNAARQAQSHSRQIVCQSCGTMVSEVLAKQNNWRCSQCGNMVESGHEQAYIPSTDPDPTMLMQRPAGVEDMPLNTPVTSAINIKYILIGAVALVIVVLGIVALVNHINKLNERRDATASVSEMNWHTKYETSKPYARDKESNSPISGNGITPYPMITRQVGQQENLVSTKIAVTLQPGPTEVEYGPEHDCDPTVATATKNEDGSYDIPQCQEETFVPGPTQRVTQIVRIYGTPTPIYQDVYPYTETGFEPATPLENNGAGKSVVCPDQSKLPAGWRISSECQKNYWIVLMYNDGEKMDWPVTESQYNLLKNNASIPVKLNGYGKIAEVTLP